MGTNYYLTSKPCEKCGRSGDRKHIGKSSAGWVFALHIYPEEGINELPDWYERWNAPDALIEDEHGKPVSPLEMLAVVVARFGMMVRAGSGMRSKDEQSMIWYMQNGAEPGPCGLARARISDRCLGAGMFGTYALHLGSEDSW